MNKNPNKSDNQKAFEQMLMGKMCFVNVKFDHLKWTTAVTAAFYWRSTGFFFFYRAAVHEIFILQKWQKKKHVPQVICESRREWLMASSEWELRNEALL